MRSFSEEGRVRVAVRWVLGVVAVMVIAVRCRRGLDGLYSDADREPRLRSIVAALSSHNHLSAMTLHRRRSFIKIDTEQECGMHPLSFVVLRYSGE